MLSLTQFTYNNLIHLIIEKNPFYANYNYESKIYKQLKSDLIQAQSTLVKIEELKKLQKSLK